MRIILAYDNCCGYGPDLNIEAFYDPLEETICVFLPLIRGSDDELIERLISIINHESLHHAFKEVLGIQTRSRVDVEHRIMKKLGIE